MSDNIVGIDIGTSKVSTVIGRINSVGEVEVLGKGTDLCTGVKKGIIVDIEAVSSSIRKSVKMAETQAEIKVVTAYVNISGLHVDIINHKNFVNIISDGKEITRNDVQKLLYSAGTMEIPEGSEIIDVVPRQYIVDGYDGITDPVGMKGATLEGDFDVVIGKIISVQNIVRSMEKAGLKVDGIIPEGFSAGECILAPDEKEMGVILIDVGGGSTEISVFKNEMLVMNKCIPVGGDHITNDLSIALKITYSEAEKVKRQLQLASTALIKHDQDITVNDISESFKKNIKVSDIIEVIEARVYEIFSICCDLVQKNCPGNYGAGVVLSGNGISTMDGSVQIANELFNLPVRIASPKIRNISGLQHCTAAGIINYIGKQDREASTTSSVSKKADPRPVKKAKQHSVFKKALNALKEFFY
ncbi:cell division protein FtsA [Ruminiclostridium cellulolyticum]|uniref:Cell division protein FtsA n=1 Tax=Ruminiclostridium cellulolyticum (strain ATCC 35319 / DSM 5812 / JCM 6584 / H10) TaxID=394503 RepID=B8I3X8_RUMCH|nr:cell division protein FtsA [Ruminiclostridium cellulolyticum]ACL76411.1 cell division protein FtsA [Ruminiclostridium cellulolyticum H10]